MLSTSTPRGADLAGVAHDSAQNCVFDSTSPTGVSASCQAAQRVDSA